MVTEVKHKHELMPLGNIKHKHATAAAQTLPFVDIVKKCSCGLWPSISFLVLASIWFVCWTPRKRGRIIRIINYHYCIPMLQLVGRGEYLPYVAHISQVYPVGATPLPLLTVG
jgi:hypothetical protein